jgi:hypothetical protein
MIPFLLLLYRTTTVKHYTTPPFLTAVRIFILPRNVIACILLIILTAQIEEREMSQDTQPTKIDLAKLNILKIEGVLIATALHSGRITIEEIRRAGLNL